ncbi:unnamed protein product [Caenorhabditis brenneri]
MPIDVVTPIIEKLDYRQQLKLRNVSKTLRALVDKQTPACKKISISCSWECVDIRFDNCFVTYTSGNGYGNGIKVIRDDFKKAAFDDLASTLKNPKLQLEEFYLRSATEEKDIVKHCNEFRNVFESLNHQVSAVEAKFHDFSPSCLFSILPYLKPGKLKKISLSLYEVRQVFDSAIMHRVASLEQWKQAEELEMQLSFDRFPMKYATHFKRFEIHEHVVNASRFAGMKNFLAKLDNFEQCTLHFYKFLFNRDEVDQIVGTLVSCDCSIGLEVFHYPIPDSDCYFEFKVLFTQYKIEIANKKREIH